MRTFRIIFVTAGVAAGFALAVGLLGRHVGRDAPASGYSPPPEAAAEAPPDAPAEAPATGAAAGSASRPSAEPLDAAGASTAGFAAEDAYAPAVPEASPERVAEIHALIVDKNRASRGRLIDALMESGLARSDSERIAGEALDDTADCVLEALRAQAAEQDVPFDRVLFTLEAVLSDADVDLAETVDVRALDARAAPCVLDVVQEAGFSLPVNAQ
jgi:hypothetical protein